MNTTIRSLLVLMLLIGAHTFESCNNPEEEVLEEPTVINEEEEEEEEEDDLTLNDYERLIGYADGTYFEHIDVLSSASAYPTAQYIDTNAQGLVMALGAYLNDWNTDDTIAGFILGNIQKDSNELAYIEDYHALFEIGSTHSFAEDGDGGVTIFYRHTDGQLYRSDWGTGLQPGSTFKITDTQEEDFLGSPTIKLMAEYDCRVYNKTGGYLQLTEGILIFETITWLK